MATHNKVETVGVEKEDIPEEMMAEFKKEIARNVEANKLMKQKEQEASLARERAAESHRKMNLMMEKFYEMERKLEWTRRTLAETHSRLEQHSNARQERIRESVDKLKDRADQCTTKLNQKSQRNAVAAEESLESGASAILVEDSGGLTDAERMLLELCQQQRKEDAESSDAEGTATNSPASDHTPDETQDEAVPKTKPSRDYARTVMDIQMKYSTSSARSNAEVSQNATPEIEATSAKEKSATEESATEELVTDGSNAEPETSSLPEKVPPVEHRDDDHEHHQQSEAKENAESEEISMDLNETVSRMEAKCAGVREELSRMAMSEQYMRTKQAQLLAKRREKEAVEAALNAAKKEHEAQEMRRKVKDMMRLLEERKNKLKMTETVLEKKAVVVEKVNKLLDNKERRANYVEKQRNEVLAFETKPKKN